MKYSNRHISAWKIILVLAAAIIFAAVSIALIPLAKALMNEEGRRIILEKAASTGEYKYIIFFALQVIQIIVVFIPGGPIPIIGSMLLGEWTAFLLSAAGSLTGTAIVYFIVKAAGKPVVNLFISDEKLNQYGFMQDPKRMERIIFLVFLCPGLPKDALTYVASLTPVRPCKFFAITTAARLPSISVSIWLGKGIADGNITMVIILAAVMLTAAAAGLFIKRKIESKRQH